MRFKCVYYNSFIRYLWPRSDKNIGTQGASMQSVRLLSGYDMPTVGLGTWQVM